MKIFGLEARKDYPAKVTIDINTQCNARCVICPYPHLKDKLKHGVMERDLYHKIIDEYADICYSNKIMGELSYCNMSEPTLLQNFPAYIKYARDKGCFTIYFNTNVSKLTPKLVDELIRSKVYPAIHLNIMTFSKTKYKKVMGLDFNTMTSNLKYFLDRYPHSLIDVGFFTPFMDDGDREAVKRVFKDTRVTLHLTDNISDRARNVELPKDLSDFQSHKRERAFGCSKNRPIHRMHVNYDGRVYLCDQDMSLETNFGNVKDNSIQEIWNGKAMIETLEVLYGHAEPGENSIPFFTCAFCIDSKKIKILKNSKDYKPRKLFSLPKRMLVKKGLAVVRKRGKLGWICP